MKKHILFLGALCALSSAFAQDAAPAEKAAENITMREGTFWPNFEVQGKIFYDGGYQDPVFNIEDQAAIDNAVNSLPSLRSNPTEYAKVVDSIGAAAFLNGSNAAAIRLLLGQEFLSRIAENDYAALTPADWSEINISPQIAEDAAQQIYNASNELQVTGILYSKDLSTIKGLTYDKIAGTGIWGLYQTILPTMDFSGYTEPQGFGGWTTLCGADLTNVTGLTSHQLSTLSGSALSGTTLPNMDLSTYVPTQYQIMQANLSKTTGLNPANLTNIGNGGLNGTRLPAGITAQQLTNAGLTNAQIAGAIFTP